MNGHDNSWFSDTAKTWMVTVTMVVLVGGVLFGYYQAYQWRQERAIQIEAEQREQMERILEE